jgi:hypothetical protein
MNLPSSLQYRATQSLNSKIHGKPGTSFNSSIPVPALLCREDDSQICRSHFAHILYGSALPSKWLKGKAHGWGTDVRIRPAFTNSPAAYC